jgi:DNA repair protein RecO (recombination protein O)
MRQFRTQAIILNRTDYGEADRIITFLTPDHGKVKAIAKGVRKQKSKLAGGIELFSVSDLSFIVGRSEINTLRSSRLIKHYGNIVKDLDRTNSGYAVIKKLDKATEDQPEPAYFYLLQEAFEVLNDQKLSLDLINFWFNSQLLRLAGHTPNLRTDGGGQKLSADKTYSFDYENMRFTEDGQGSFSADHIKFLRLAFSPNSAKNLSRIKQAARISKQLQPVVQSMLQNYIRI